jgi:hypothetical protein
MMHQLFHNFDFYELDDEKFVHVHTTNRKTIQKFLKQKN